LCWAFHFLYVYQISSKSVEKCLHCIGLKRRNKPIVIIIIIIIITTLSGQKR
jgi:hypothetical protein